MRLSLTNSLGTAPEDAAEFRLHLRELNTDSLRVVSLLGGFLMPLFWIMDLWVLPQHLPVTLVLRLIATVSAIGIVVGIRHNREVVVRNVDWLGFGYTWIVAATISAMCWLHAGLESPYYAGLNLVLVGAGVLFIWPLRMGLLFCLAVWATYMLPLPLGILDTSASSEFVSSQFFIIGTIVITLAAQERRFELQLETFVASRALERTKQSLELAYDSLKEHQRLRTQFFNNVTHELRTPLTMILAPLESLTDGELGNLSEDQRSLLLPIHANGMRLLKLINDLLDLAKLEENYLRLRLQQTDLRRLVTDIVDHSRPLAARKGIQLDLDIVDTHEDIFVDVDKMERVIVNLLSNALKFTECGGRVVMRLKRSDDGVCLSIADDGPGIAPEQQTMIFERFRQADGEITRRRGGTGIGLSLAKEFVDLHGGQMALTSEVGRGSVFSVHLRRGRGHLEEDRVDRRRGDGTSEFPRRAEDREPQEWTQQLLERPEYRFLSIHHATERRTTDRGGDSPKATRILLVEDNADLLRFVALLLSEHHSVTVATDGRKALELAQRRPPDLIVTDYMMPELDGLSLIAALKANESTAQIPVIMLTAKNRLEDRLRAREIGADVYLGKPFSPRELRLSVEQLLRRRDQQVGLVLRERVKSLEIISAGLAHEIHNPLSSIKTASFIIAEEVARVRRLVSDQTSAPLAEELAKSVERAEQMLSIADRGIERIRRIVELVRSYSSDGYPSDLEPLALDQTVSQTAALVPLPLDRTANVTLELNAPDVRIRCIPVEFEQVIRSLWQNAVDAVPDGGHVWIRTRASEGWAILEVEDDGPGVPRELQARIFTPFFTTKAPGHGMGLGLAIAHQIVTSLHGEVAVESAPGTGSTFRVRLPFKLETPQLTRQRADESPPA